MVVSRSKVLVGEAIQATTEAKVKRPEFHGIEKKQSCNSQICCLPTTAYVLIQGLDTNGSWAKSVRIRLTIPKDCVVLMARDDVEVGRSHNTSQELNE